MVKGTTNTGFEFEVDEEVTDDIELLDLLRKTRKDATYMIDVCELVLGSEQRDRLYDHCRNEKGRVKASLIDKEMEDIFLQLAAGKNS